MQQNFIMLKPTKNILKPICLFAFVAFSLLSIHAQDVQRIEVSGKIIVDSPDVEGVTIFNASSNKGTITDAEGKFNILVTLTDGLQFSVLQFKNFEVVITQDIIDSKAMTVVLVEEVNKLPEIIILPYGLTGNLDIDAIRAKTVNPDLDALYFGLDNLDKIEFTDDYLTGIRNTAMTDNRLYYTADAIKIIGMLVKALFKDKNKKEKELLSNDRDIVDKYSPGLLFDKNNIHENYLIDFILFVEDSPTGNESGIANGGEFGSTNTVTIVGVNSLLPSVATYVNISIPVNPAVGLSLTLLTSLVTPKPSAEVVSI